MPVTFVQTDTQQSFNIACSGQTQATISNSRLASQGGTPGSSEYTVDPGNNQTRACFSIPCGTAGLGLSTWQAGDWVIPINHTTMDGGTQLVRVDVCDFDGTSYASVVNTTSPGHTRGATGVVTVTINRATNYTPQSTANSRPFIVLTYNNNDLHGGASHGITPDQTITTPIVVAHTIAADGGSYTKTGTAASLEYGRVVAADAGVYTLTGTDATLTHTAGDPVLTADAGSYAITGTDASLEYGRTISAETNSYSVTGTAASLEFGRVVAANTGSYNLTGTDVNLLRDTLVTLNTDSYTVSGQDAGLFKGLKLVADTDTFSITGTNVSLLRDGIIASDSGVYTVTGTDATLTWSGEGAVVLVAEGGSYVLTGTDSSLEYGRGIALDAGLYTLSGTASNLEYQYTIDAVAGTYSVTGTDVSFNHAKSIIADAGIYTVTGTDVSLIWSGESVIPVRSRGMGAAKHVRRAMRRGR